MARRRLPLSVVLATTLAAFVAGVIALPHAGAPHDVRPQQAQQGTSPSAALPVFPLSHSGQWLTDADGRVVVLHGVNEVVKYAPYYPSARDFSDADAAWLAANGFWAVRLGVLVTGLLPAPGTMSTQYLDELAATVGDLGRHHIAVLLDFHQDDYGPVFGGADGFPAWMTRTDGVAVNPSQFPLAYTFSPGLQQAFQSFWDDQAGPGGKGLQEDYLAGLAAVARRFGGDPWVLGYEFLNEPWPGRSWAACLSSVGCAALERSELAPFYAKADHTVREFDTVHLVFGEPFVLFNFGQSLTSLPLPGGDAKSGLAFHEYALSATGAQGTVTNAQRWSRSTGGALLMTEFGASADPTAIESQVSAFDPAMISWLFWDYGTVMSNSGSGFAPAPSAAQLAALGVLERPYPLAVAGTPGSLTYSSATHAFAFDYSTAPVSGGAAFGAGSVTSIEAPPLAYPHGYAVHVSGARVMSAPCAAVLELASVAGAAKVTVTLTPSGACPVG